MKKLSTSSYLDEKIYDLKIDGNGILSTITSYFPLNATEKQEILKAIDKPKKASVDFKSIFSDKISEQEWGKSKEQIKKKFQDGLVKID
jgi:hypothetical protein